MTVHHDQPNDWISERIRIEQENAEKRRLWEHQQAQQREQQEREAKQAELKSYLMRRGAEWQDTTGSSPSASVLERWTEEFLNEKQIEAEAERMAKIEDGSVI